MADFRKTEKRIAIGSNNGLVSVASAGLLKNRHVYDTLVVDDCAIRGIQLEVVG